MSDAKITPVDLLLEAAASAYRERDALGRILPSPAWFDLSPEDRDRLFDLQMESRAWERLVRSDGLSGTAAAVMQRVRRLGQYRG